MSVSPMKDHHIISSPYLNNKYICNIQLEDRNGNIVHTDGDYIRVTINNNNNLNNNNLNNNNNNNNNNILLQSSSALLCIPWLLDNCLSRRHSSGQRAETLYNERGNINNINNNNNNNNIPTSIAMCYIIKGEWANCNNNNNNNLNNNNNNKYNKARSIRMGATNIIMRRERMSSLLGNGDDDDNNNNNNNNKEDPPIILHVVFNKIQGSDAPELEANIPISLIDKYIIIPQLLSLSKENLIKTGQLSSKTKAIKSYSEIFKIDYSKLLLSSDENNNLNNNLNNNNNNNNYEIYTAMKHIAKDGLILIKNCGIENNIINNLGNIFGNGLMKTLYGTTWHVQSQPKYGPINNVAYSTAPLDLHQDIPYYESMPGVQLLHCQKFNNNNVNGGMSLFLDSFLLAERFREEYPEEFEVLCKIPVAFMKDDLEREEPAQYYYCTPHFHINDNNNIIKTFWSPAFEAPLPHSGPTAERYYKAREALCKILKEIKNEALIRFHLEEGDCVIFLQARMFHGREGFSESIKSSRVLHGGYIHNEDFISKLLSMAVMEGDEEALLSWDMRGFGNRSYR